jgi:hypothetical protein
MSFSSTDEVIRFTKGNTNELSGIIVNDPSVDIKVTSKSFHNCKFKTLKVRGNGDILFANCEFEELHFGSNGYVNSFRLENCSAKFVLLQTGGDNKFQTLQVDGGSIDIFHFKGTAHTATFEKVTFKKFEISDSKITSVLSLEELTAITTLFIRQSEIEDFAIEQIAGCEAIIDSCQFREIFVSSSKDVEVGMMTVSATNTHFFGNTNQNLFLTDFTSDTILLEGGTYGTISLLGDCDFNLETFPVSEGDNKDAVQRSTVKALIIRDSIVKADRSVQFKSMDFNLVKFENLQNDGTIILSNSEITQRLQILESDLQQTRFNNISLTPQCDFDLLDSDISDVTFNNFKWNKHFQLSEKYSNEKYDREDGYLLTLRESYRQLKSNHLKNNNKIIALEFQKHELRIHLQIVQKSVASAWKRSGEPFLNPLGNYFVLWTHKAASDFGMNVWKPLLFLFLFHFVFFNTLLVYTPELNLTPFENISWQATQDAWGKYFYTLLPIHTFNLPRFESSIEAKPIFIAGFWDFLMRLSSGYFIFYFLTASRKYHQ